MFKVYFPTLQIPRGEVKGILRRRDETKNFTKK